MNTDKYINFWKVNVALDEDTNNWKLSEFNPDIFNLTNFYSCPTESKNSLSAHAIVYFRDDQEIILVLNRDSEMEHYNLPGGGREKLEFEKQTLSRELNEELGIILDTHSAIKLGGLEKKEKIFSIYSVCLLDSRTNYDWKPGANTVGIRLVSFRKFKSSITLTSPFGKLLHAFELNLNN